MEPQVSRFKSTKSDKHIAGLYDMEHSLGSGHFAVVKLARHVFTGEKVAVKVIDKSKLDDVAKAHLYQEVRCMKLVQHPNIVRLYEVIDTQTKLYLILEYGDGGDMYDHIMRYEGKGISEEKAQHYFKQILSAIDYCHRLHVVHRDLKPENVIFFKTQDIAKLTDFGFSNNFLPGEKLFTSCGSLAYSAPEILLGDSYDAPAVDVWSLGVILYMMVCGRGPFNHANDSETLTMIMDCRYDLPDNLSTECKSLISRMLVRQPSKRSSMESIINDAWVKSGSPEAITLKPLICEISISSDVHAIVLQKMENGKISNREQIENSLQDKKYNHIAATYFLLAERVLKRRHGAGALHVKLENSYSSPDGTVVKRSSSKEKSCENVISKPSIETHNVPSYPITNDLTREHSQSDECLATESYDNDFQLKTMQLRSHRMTYPNAIYNKQKTKSTPNLLNEISEEHESEMDDSPRSSPMLQRRASQRRRKYHTCRLSPIHSRRSSCSSSDDDEMHILSERRRISALTIPHVGNHLNTTSEQNSRGGKQNNNVLPLFDECKEIDAQLANLLLPAVSLRLDGLTRYTYGRHFSDTNLTSYSMQLQIALAQRNFKNKHQLTKSCSDTNLASTLSNISHNALLTSHVIRNKDLFFKYLRRGKNGSKSGSSLSLSSPIEEEPNDEDSKQRSFPNSTKQRQPSSDTDLSKSDTQLRYHLNSILSRDQLAGVTKIVSAYSSRQLAPSTSVKLLPSV